MEGKFPLSGPLAQPGAISSSPSTFSLPRAAWGVLNTLGSFLGYGPPSDFVFIFKPSHYMKHSPGI